MTEAMLLAGAAVAALVGFGWLALAMETHWDQAHAPRALAPRRALLLRIAGSVAVVGSLLLCLGADHPSMAVLVWFMLLAGSAITIAMVLSWRPRWLRWLGA
ncbi:DUF3325 domain-containing protein [Mitsuaria sp. GD03876]|uniref:DUF3325 domain-containing protein n=1 Tax=Mitsuaria sp. GD03876 TaxID=2975399 RepID=UPI00244A3548|nr:DUF3325 domain-containing protein [Mitsuaria sp. GD03876]MDH0864397.1 DUF3325 domain-containing protein [Mitsuaria sp. GD03876]